MDLNKQTFIWDACLPLLDAAASLLQLRGTIYASSGFNPASDAKALRKAMKGFGR